MNHAIASSLPKHITHIRENNVIWARQADGSFDPLIVAKTIGSAKRIVRVDLHCVGGHKSNVRTAQSLDLL